MLVLLFITDISNIMANNYILVVSRFIINDRFWFNFFYSEARGMDTFALILRQVDVTTCQ